MRCIEYHYSLKQNRVFLDYSDDNGNRLNESYPCVEYSFRQALQAFRKVHNLQGKHIKIVCFFPQIWYNIQAEKRKTRQFNMLLWLSR